MRCELEQFTLDSRVVVGFFVFCFFLVGIATGRVLRDQGAWEGHTRPLKHWRKSEDRIAKAEAG